MSLRARDDIHLSRRFWHFGGVMLMFIIYWFSTPKQALVLAAIAAGILIFFDVLRLRVRRFNVFFVWLFRRIIRDSELNHISGITFMMTGMTIVVALYPKNVVLLVMLFVALADPIASEIGIRFGKDKLIGNKSLQGSFAAFLTCFVLSLAYFTHFGLVPERRFIVCLLAGLIGAVSELAPIGDLDDNLVFPVLSATLLTGTLHVFGGL
jgi:diacylglycerol kinase (CTP)